MSNVLKFPLGGASDAAERSHVAAPYLAEPPANSHAVQFYDNEDFLFDTVGQFLAAGLKSGDHLVVIATAEHRAGFVGRLAVSGPEGVETALATGQLMLLDARETLAKFMVGGMPDPDLFRDLLSRLMSKLRGVATGARVRTYGEMVDSLWREGNPQAAIRLEELWNDARNDHSFELLCAYLMGNFYKEGEAARFMDVCRTHTHVIPTESFAQLEDPHARLREIAFLQQRARSLASEVENRKELEGALRDALRERARAEEELRASLKREQEGRAQAEASDAFKEVFLGMLGHDLRNPLNTVLTTARLMALRGEVSGESSKRLDRIVSSGVRMQRMIEQILDVTRARLASGIPIKPTEQDLVALVTRIVDEVSAANVGHVIELGATGSCLVSVDPDRFEQVVSNLLCNAIAHGDPALPITVLVMTGESVASFSVHNHGEPIEPAFMPMLFDPFKRERPAMRSEGLGLGLYISERIVSAHGGTIEVDSCSRAGTRFEVKIPLR